MKILGIESSCDETAAAVVEDGRKVLSKVIATSLNEHKIYGGVVPEIASRRHAESISGVVEQALKDANCTMDDIEAVAVTYAPGLIGSLLVGVGFAKGLALACEKPLVPVHHLRGHIASNYISSDIEPPFLCLVVSGGHSHIVAVKSYTDFEVIGKTRDDAAGEALDKAGRTMKLEYPGGVSIDRISPQGDENAFAFPKPRIAGSPYDYSFSGIKTSLLYFVRDQLAENPSFMEENKEDICASFQRHLIDILMDKLIKAARDTGISEVTIGGGVSANSELRARLQEEGRKRGWNTYLPEFKFTTDNAAMIAIAGYYHYLAGERASLSVAPAARAADL